MGGRGGSSFSSNNFNNELKARLMKVYETNKDAKIVIARDQAILAKTAADLVGTDKVRQLSESRDVLTLYRAYDYDRSGVGIDILGKLRNLESGYNMPMWMKESEFKQQQQILERLHSQGFTTEEIAAAMAYDRWLVQTW